MREDNLTTLCYITKGDKCLFIVKKNKKDPNQGKYLGIGGHFETGETPEECILREINEESGITPDELKDFKFSGLATFLSDEYGIEYMHIFKAEYVGNREVTPGNCDEGELMWIPLTDIYDLPIWEGDKEMFHMLFDQESFFTLKLEYKKDTLVGISKKTY